MNRLRPYRRRHLFVHKAFQGRFILWIVGVIILFSLCSGGLLYLVLDSALDSRMHSAHVQIENLWHQLSLAILLGNVLAILMAGLAAALVVLTHSHKIAGPLYRIRQVLKSIAKGDFNASTSLRAGDQLQELAESLEEAQTYLRQCREKRLELINESEKLLKGDAPAAKVVSLMKENLRSLKKMEQ